MNIKTEATNISQSRTVCASRKSWNASQLTTKSNRPAPSMSRLSAFNMVILLIIDYAEELPNVLSSAARPQSASAAAIC
jgi:hypothetical protein